ncbi:hypothetical protein ABIC90_004825 [Variovorax boronicumulans]
MPLPISQRFLLLILHIASCESLPEQRDTTPYHRRK